MEFWTLKEAFSNFSSSTLMEIWTLSSHGERALPFPPPQPPRPPLPGSGPGVVGLSRRWFTSIGWLDSEVGAQYRVCKVVCLGYCGQITQPEKLGKASRDTDSQAEGP